MGLTIDKITIQINDQLSIQVGQVLKMKSEKNIVQAVKENLKILLNTNFLSETLKELEDFFNFKNNINQFHNQAIYSQFYSVRNKINGRWEIDLKSKTLKTNAFKIEKDLNKLRSILLGLPQTTYGIGIEKNGKYYYLPSGYIKKSPEQLLEKISYHSAEKRIGVGIRNKQAINDAKEQLQEVIKIIEGDTFLRHLGEHYTSMIIAMQESKGNPKPKSKWTAEVFQAHIQQTNEKNNYSFEPSDTWYPQHNVRNVWKRYHETAPYYYKGHKIHLASQTQGGDAGETLVKNFVLSKSKTTPVDALNLNNLQDIYNFWIYIKNNINNNNIEDLIYEILSVLLSAENIKQLGLEATAELRGFDLNNNNWKKGKQSVF